jgi:hypothetical protein
MVSAINKSGVQRMSTDWAVIFATVVGPILAVYAADIRADRKSQRNRQEWVFRSLMTTRSVRLHRDHIQALNHIDFAFPAAKYPDVSDSWGLYLAHLNKNQGETEDSIGRWSEEADNLLADLIHLMAKELKIPFSKTQIKQPSYYPKGHAVSEELQNELRIFALAVLKHGRPINIRPIPPEQQPQEEGHP